MKRKKERKKERKTSLKGAWGDNSKKRYEERTEEMKWNEIFKK